MSRWLPASGLRPSKNLSFPACNGPLRLDASESLEEKRADACSQNRSFEVSLL